MKSEGGPMGLLCRIRRVFESDPEIERGLEHFHRPKDRLAFATVMRELRKRHPQATWSELTQTYDLEVADDVVSMRLRAGPLNGDDRHRELVARCHFRGIRLLGVLPRRSMPIKVVIRGEKVDLTIPIEGLNRWICVF